MDAKLLEVLLRLTADALKGREDAGKALGDLGQAMPSPDALSAWVSAWLPKEASRWGPREVSEFQSLVEQSWRATGVVPRYRYLELLEKYEELKAKLEETEGTVRNLRELLEERGHEQEVRSALDRWEESTRRALESQTDWARSCLEGVFGAPAREDKKKERS